MALAEAVGARCCVDIAGSYNPTVWYGPNPKNLSQQFFDATVDNCRHVIDEIKPKRARFTIEAMGWSIPDGPDSYVKLIKAVDRPAFGVHLDVCNIINSPERFYRNSEVIADCFRKLGPWIVSCHAKDLAWIVELNVHFQEVIPGRGEIDYRTYLNELSQLTRRNAADARTSEDGRRVRRRQALHPKGGRRNRSHIRLKLSVPSLSLTRNLLQRGRISLYTIAMQISLSRRRLFALLPFFPAAKALLAQQSPTFTTDVNVVNLFATVRDKDGHLVNNLSKDDFTLQEDGRPQMIRYFSRETDLPLTLGLLVDTSRSQRNVIDAERSASYTFFEHVLREDKDQAFVLHFDHQVELLQDLTPSRQKLNKALHALEVDEDDSRQQSSGGNPGGGYPGGSGRGGRGAGSRHGGGTLLYDAIYLASGDDLMKKQKGRKALLVLTDGVDRGSKVSISEAIEAAQRSDTLVYSIYFASNEGFPGFGRGMGHGGGMGRGGGTGRGRYPQEERPDGKKVLRRISKETGGTFFEVSKKQTIDNIYSHIEEELRNQYSLGYASDQPASQTGYRTITLIVNKKNMTAQTREGYYPAQPGAPN